MIVVVILIAVATLVYLLIVAGLASQFNHPPHRSSVTWCARFLRRLERLRMSLWMMFFLMATNAVAFFLPALMGGAQGYLASLFGGVDLLSAIVLYGTWKWTGRLRRSVLMHLPK